MIKKSLWFWSFEFFMLSLAVGNKIESCCCFLSCIYFSFSTTFIRLFQFIDTLFHFQFCSLEIERSSKTSPRRNLSSSRDNYVWNMQSSVAHKNNKLSGFSAIKSPPHSKTSIDSKFHCMETFSSHFSLFMIGILIFFLLLLFSAVGSVQTSLHPKKSLTVQRTFLEAFRN